MVFSKSRLPLPVWVDDSHQTSDHKSRNLTSELKPCPDTRSSWTSAEKGFRIEAPTLIINLWCQPWDWFDCAGSFFCLIALWCPWELPQECSDIFNRGVSPAHGLCCTEDWDSFEMQAAGMIICHHPKILCHLFLSFARVASSHFSLVQEWVMRWGVPNSAVRRIHPMTFPALSPPAGGRW